MIAESLYYVYIILNHYITFDFVSAKYNLSGKMLYSSSLWVNPYLEILYREQRTWLAWYPKCNKGLMLQQMKLMN